jgi:hypothetical protein
MKTTESRYVRPDYTLKLFKDFSEFELSELFFRNLPDFVMDLWCLLFDGIRQHRNAPQSGYEWAHLLLEEAESLPQMRSLIARTEGDPWSVHIAGNMLSEPLAGTLEATFERIDDGNALDFETRVVDEIAGLTQLGISALPGATEGAARSKVQAKAKAFAAEVSNTMPLLRNIIRDLIPQILTRLDELEDMEEVCGDGWGKGKSGLPSKGDLERRKKMASLFDRNPKIREIIKLAGKKMRVAERKQARKVNSVPEEIVGIEYGDDMSRLVATEFGMFAAGGAARSLFLKNYADESLQQYRMEGNEPVGRGPIVFLMDSSGSMDGQREVWAKAMAIAMMHIARKQNRDFVVAEFDTRVQEIFRAEKGVFEWDVLVSWLGQNCSGGGTEFEPALDWALSTIEQSKIFDKADVIFVTDGEAHVRPDWQTTYLTRKSELRTRVIGLGVFCGTGVLSDLCDEAVQVNELSLEGAADDAIFSI